MSQCKPFVLSGDQWTDLVMTGMYEQQARVVNRENSIISFSGGDNFQIIIQHTILAGKVHIQT